MKRAHPGSVIKRDQRTPRACDRSVLDCLRHLECDHAKKARRCEKTNDNTPFGYYRGASEAQGFVTLHRWRNDFVVCNRSHVDRLRNYIRNQEVHHANESFQDEFRPLMTIYRLKWDERDVWD